MKKEIVLDSEELKDLCRLEGELWKVVDEAINKNGVMSSECMDALRRWRPVYLICYQFLIGGALYNSKLYTEEVRNLLGEVYSY